MIVVSSQTMPRSQTKLPTHSKDSSKPKFVTSGSILGQIGNKRISAVFACSIMSKDVPNRVCLRFGELHELTFSGFDPTVKPKQSEHPNQLLFHRKQLECHLRRSQTR